MLKFYSSLDRDTLLATDANTDGDRFTLSFDGRQGGAQVRQFFITNDDPDVSYEDITVEPIDTSGEGLVDTGGASWSWKLIEQDTPPTEGAWKDISDGASLSLDDIEDASVMVSIWVRVQAPQYTPAQSILSVRLRVQANEVLNA
tara:strand:- start:717 stop:1151 length:435 start_codon:yes stop_codon:yes gene_type:complete